MTRPRHRILAAALGSALAVTSASANPTASAQVELDRVVARVGTKVITLSDVRQSRLLLLVDDTESDDDVTRCLIERALLLNEIARAQPLRPATDADLAARRAEWERRLGGADRRVALLSQAGMADSALQPWFRDDLRIQAYLQRQFGSLPEEDRAKAKADLLLRLRQRAGLR